MPFIEELLNYGSLSIVGLEKNTGKTECLNYILKRLPLNKIKVGVSSIGLDGERTDQVTRSSKPEIILREGIIFTTSEKHYKQRRIISELIDVDDQHTSLGRLITARAISKGKVMLSGPPSSLALKRWIDRLKANYSVDLCIIDGALSRLSPASPAISEAMIMATGAALSVSINELIKKTAFTVELIGIEKTKKELDDQLIENSSGVWSFNSITGDFYPLYESAFTLDKKDEPIDIKLNRTYDVVFISGALTDRLLKKISSRKEDLLKEIVVRDFTKIFVAPLTYRNFIKKGGKISVLQKSNLIAVCVNPVSPNGYSLDSNMLCKELEAKIELPVYDIFNYVN
ncbi:MAG: hypothetical protein WCR71_02380 [Bacteroidales bacterium]